MAMSNHVCIVIHVHATHVDLLRAHAGKPATLAGHGGASSLGIGMAQHLRRQRLPVT
jgi:hypothetical protein